MQGGTIRKNGVGYIAQVSFEKKKKNLCVKFRPNNFSQTHFTHQLILAQSRLHS